MFFNRRRTQMDADSDLLDQPQTHTDSHRPFCRATRRRYSFGAASLARQNQSIALRLKIFIQL
jgi:hypothetical protein